MTLVCYDDIYAADLPAGADAYLGYVDGYWPDYATEVQKFTSANIIGLTVYDIQQGQGCDIEKGDLTVQQGAAWVKEALSRVTRPICYAAVSDMTAVISELTGLGVARSDYRVMTAHWGIGSHICGPDSCRYPGLTEEADGTQWTNQAQGLNGTKIDESWLQDNFFDGQAVPPPPAPVPQVPPAKRNIFTPVVEDGIFGYHTCAALQFVIFSGNIADVDGYFGPLSKKQLQRYLNVQPDGVIRALQQRVGAKQDGVWGPITTTDLQISLNKGLF
jgi:peptidoglycan hydrolase-like protein with peptidoglycan-binding domain